MADFQNVHTELLLEGKGHPCKVALDMPLDGDLDEHIDRVSETAARLGLLGVGRDVPADKVTITVEVGK